MGEMISTEHQPPSIRRSRGGVRALTDDQRAALVKSLDACTLNIKIDSDIASDKEIVRSELMRKHGLVYENMALPRS